MNTNVFSLINPCWDRDVYKIATTNAASKLKVTLSTLPYDYDLRLCNSSGSIIASSSLPGTSSETNVYHLANSGATYYIQVLS